MKHKFKITSALAVVASVLLLASSASASLLNDPDGVNGSLMFGGGGTNFFDPANGGVPGGFGNSAPNDHLGVPVGANVEFGYGDGFSTVEVDLAAESIWITQLPAGGAGAANSWEIWLEDLEWGVPGTIVNLIAGAGNNIPGLIAGVGMGGDSVHFSFAGSPPDLPVGGWSAHFDLVVDHGPTVPEPATMLLLGFGLTGLTFVRRRRSIRA